MVRLIPRAVLALAFLAVAVPVSVQAQRFSPAVGVYAPIGDLGQIQGPSGLVDFGKKDGTLAYGLGVEFGASDSFLGLRVGAVYAGTSDVPISGVGCTNCALRSTLLAASAGVVLQPIPTRGFRPYVLVGAGGKLYNFDPDTVTGALVEDQTQFVGHFGAGIRLFPDAGLSLFAELSDYVSGFEFADGNGDLQHDLFFMVGLSLGR